MALYVVDTNVISYLLKLKGGYLRKDKERANKYESLLRGNEIARAFPTVAELQVWVHTMEEGDKKVQYTKGIHEIMEQTSMIDGDDRVAQHWANIINAGLKAGHLHVHDSKNPKREAQLNDTWIAACALAHGLTLVTDNRKDFDWMQAAVGLDMVCYSGA
jgi:predicted nucleic acid-binding protein